MYCVVTVQERRILYEHFNMHRKPLWRLFGFDNPSTSILWHRLETIIKITINANHMVTMVIYNFQVV